MPRQTVHVTLCPGDQYFFYVRTGYNILADHISEGWDTQDEAEQAAIKYALNHSLALYLYDDPDGSQGALAMEQAIERDERLEQMEVK